MKFCGGQHKRKGKDKCKKHSGLVTKQMLRGEVVWQAEGQ